MNKKTLLRIFDKTLTWIAEKSVNISERIRGYLKKTRERRPSKITFRKT
jgi:hypothetical protein